MGYSGAGQNRVGSFGGKQLFASNIVAASSSLTVGVNDTGPIMKEALAFSKWLIQPVGTFGAGTAQVYAIVLGTIDPNTAGTKYQPGNPSNPSGVVAPTAFNWFPLIAPSSETTGDAFQWANPLYGNNSSQVATLGAQVPGSNITDSLFVPAIFAAIRVIVITVPGASGTATNPNCNVLALALE